jgi:hypothetical protein
MPGPATTPKHQIKRHGEGRERRFITWLGTCHGKRQSRHSVHLQPFLMYRHKFIGLRRQRTGAGIKKVCIVKQFSHRYGLDGHYLSLCSERVLGETQGGL